MIDLFVLLLTPILVLGIIALLGFVGCDQVFGLHQFDPNPIDVAGVTPPSGTPAGGTNVVITGSQFASGCSVTFGGAAANSVMVSSGGATITANTPANPPGAVDVTVTNPDGNTGTLQTGFTYVAVSHLQTVRASVTAGATTISATLPDFGSGKLVVASVQWSGSGTLSLSGAPFVLLENDFLNPGSVATHYANGISGGNTVTATLSAPTTTAATLLVSVYDFAGSGSPDQAGAAQGLGTTALRTFQTGAVSPGDLVYSVVFSRAPGGGPSGTLSPGASPAFTAESGQGSFLMLQDYVLQPTDVTAGSIDVSAINSTGTATSHWYVFAMRISHA